MCEGSCGPSGHGRRYYTKEERKAFLEDYAKELQSELQAVNERIQQLGQE